VTSSVTVIQALVSEKSCILSICNYKSEKRRDAYHRNFYRNFSLKDDLRMNHSLLKQMMQEGTITSFALYDPYCTNMAHEQ